MSRRVEGSPPILNSNRVRELNRLRPRLREDICLHFPTGEKEPVTVLEDPVRSKYHRLGPAETMLLQELDGRRYFGEAYAQACIRSGADSLTEDQALQFLGWLIEQRLVQVGSALPDTGLREESTRNARQKMLQGLNLISVRIPFGSPAKWLEPIRPYTSIACGRVALILTGLIVAIAFATAWTQTDQIALAYRGILAPHNWLTLAVVWIGLKLWHESAHALACMHYGGRVREAGILLIVLMPLGYVDASASLAFSSRWKRIHVAAAGMIAELLLAALAFLLWLRLDPGAVRHALFQIALMGSVVTLVFNLNPLMRFDGYYILCDLLRIPNLGTRSQAWLKHVILKHLLGMNDLSEPPTGGHSPAVYLLYGVAAWIWKIFILLTLITAAGLLLGGGGWLLVGITVLSMSANKVMALRRSAEQGFFDRIRWSVALPRIAGVVLAFLLIFFTPFQQSQVFPGVLLQPRNPAPRPQGAGRLAEIHTQDGDQLPAGATLAVLENPETELRLSLAQIRYRLRSIYYRQAILEGAAQQIQAEQSALTALQDQARELQEELDSLRLVTSEPGILSARQLSARQGSWIPAGTEVAQLLQSERFRIHIAIPQDESDIFRKQAGQPVDLLFESRSRAGRGEFLGVDGRATRSPGLPELTAPTGGPIAVQQGPEGVEWLDPVFIGRVDPVDLPEKVRLGERVYVRFNELGRSALWRKTRLSLRRIGDFFLTRAEDRQQ